MRLAQRVSSSVWAVMYMGIRRVSSMLSGSMVIMANESRALAGGDSDPGGDGSVVGADSAGNNLLFLNCVAILLCKI